MTIVCRARQRIIYLILIRENMIQLRSPYKFNYGDVTPVFSDAKSGLGRIMQKILLALLLMLCFHSSAHAEMIFTYRSPEHEGDTRYHYDNSLLKLALDLTVEEFGPYKLEPSPVMNFTRAIKMAESGAYPNFMLKLSYEERLKDTLDFVPVDIDRGIVGYRVFFVSQKNKEKIAGITTHEELKKLKIIQGQGWSDVPLLRAAGFDNVIELASYESLFPYVAEGRADILPRGANELMGEYNAHKNIEGLTYDEKLILYYPLPRFFYTTKGNDAAIARVNLGLQKAMKDGSFLKLWKKEYQTSIDFLKMKDRKIFKIPNSNLGGLGDDDYEKYSYDPLKE